MTFAAPGLRGLVARTGPRMASVDMGTPEESCRLPSRGDERMLGRARALQMATAYGRCLKNHPTSRHPTPDQATHPPVVEKRRRIGQSVTCSAAVSSRDGLTWIEVVVLRRYFKPRFHRWIRCFSEERAKNTATNGPESRERSLMKEEIHVNWNCEVVQRRKGLRIHHS
ncbi:hypothetical protein PLANTIT3_60842 [Plantibacter sp. T3]|nr:hypothetical protein PLANTIT3_60842 [Plantibacter sp. T3]